MRAWLTFAVVLVCFAALALTAGCPKPAEETSTVGAPMPVKAADIADDTPGDEDTAADPDEETEEEELARGRAVMAEFPDATEPPVDWSWDPETPIDPAAIPDEPVAGVCEGKLFIVKHAILQHDVDEEEGTSSWDLRFIDVDPDPGNEASMFFHDGRHIELTLPEAGKGTKIEMPYDSDSENWGLDKLWFWYYTPREDSPDGISINPGGHAVALYVEFTEWDETPPEGIEDAIGTAKGKIAVGSTSVSDGSVCWLAGNFEAVIGEP